MKIYGIFFISRWLALVRLLSFHSERGRARGKFLKGGELARAPLAFGHWAQYRTLTSVILEIVRNDLDSVFSALSLACFVRIILYRIFHCYFYFFHLQTFFLGSLLRLVGVFSSSCSSFFPSTPRLVFLLCSRRWFAGAVGAVNVFSFAGIKNFVSARRRKH